MIFKKPGWTWFKSRAGGHSFVERSGKIMCQNCGLILRVTVVVSLPDKMKLEESDRVRLNVGAITNCPKCDKDVYMMRPAG